MQVLHERMPGRDNARRGEALAAFREDIDHLPVQIRCGRGDSRDTPPYAVQRDVECGTDERNPFTTSVTRPTRLEAVSPDNAVLLFRGTPQTSCTAR